MYMLCAPARIAGVRDISVCTPPAADGSIDAASLVAADICGVRNIFKVGGAQAIAAFAYGTQTISKVAKVEGPGSPYVAAAKRVVSNVIDSGMPAGPSESIVLADSSASPHNTALDMMNEAEHGPDSAAFLVTDSKELVDSVLKILPELIESLPEPRRSYCKSVFENYGGIMLCRDMSEAIDFCNEYAAEHLLIKALNPFAIIERIQLAGEILIGEATPMVMGNFGIGINAVLPTGGHARTHDCTSVWTFLKRTSLSYMNAEGYHSIRDNVLTLANYEGFPGHADTLRKRDETVFEKGTIT
jgi:histidinol dehydrogenase